MPVLTGPGDPGRLASGSGRRERRVNRLLDDQRRERLERPSCQPPSRSGAFLLTQRLRATRSVTSTSCTCVRLGKDLQRLSDAS